MRNPALLLVLGLLACGGDKPHGKVHTTPSDSGSTSTPTGTTTGTTTTPTGYVGSPALQFEGSVPKNILFLSIDTFRKDHWGTYGSTKGLTPFLDTIAEQGVVIDQYHQCSNWTYGSTTCTLAGRTNIERGHMPRLNGNAANRPPVPDNTPFLATWLVDAGYYTGIVSGNDWLSARWGNTQGYIDEDKPGGLADAVFETGLGMLGDALANGHQGPWFLHLHFMEPHANYDPPEDNVIGEDLLEPWPEDLRNRSFHYWARDNYEQYTPSEQALLEAHLRLLYEGEIRTIDQGIEAGWAQLEAEGYLDDTLVVFWTDHGEAFWEHGFQTHAYNLTGEVNDAALIFWSKNIVPGRWTEPVASIDVVPTLLDLQGIDIPDEVTGVPVGTADPTRPIFTSSVARLGGMQAVVKDGYKLEYVWGDGSVRVWDRNVDPLETNDIFDPTDPKVLELWDLLKPQTDAMAPLIVGGLPYPHDSPELP